MLESGRAKGLVTVVIIVAVILIGVWLMERKKDNGGSDISETGNQDVIELPDVQINGSTTVEEALLNRRSIRVYSSDYVTLTELGQLLWAAQGITMPDRGFRTAPSAGGLYPLELFVAAGSVTDLAAGIYRYGPANHTLEKIAETDVLPALSEAAISQESVRDGSVAIVIAAVYQRTQQKYGDRGVRYVHMEVGHAAQNVYLQAESLNLGTVFIGAFIDEEVQDIMGMDQDELPLGIMPVGRRR
jgi:SagB-type dehydrogenase family enzyme